MKRTICILILLLLLSGCDTYGMLERYPYDKADVWYCEKIDATIDFTVRDATTDTVFCWNGITYYCGTAWVASYTVFLYDENGDGIINSPDEKILEGEWKYKNKKLVIEIIRSNLFGDAFSELTFVPVYEE